MTLHVGIEGIQQAQEANLRNIAALKPSGAFGRAIQYGLIAAHRYVLSVTHVVTGTLKGSHRIAQDSLRGQIYIDPSAVNPRTGQRAAIYGITEHERGGEHAFYQRTYDEYGDKVARVAGDALIGAIR